MEKIKITPKKYFNNVLITFVTVFSMMVGINSIIDGAIFKQTTITFTSAMIVALISFIASNLIVLFFKINKITFLIQVSTIYLILVLLILINGFVANWFSFKKIGFIFLVFAISLIGLFIIYTIIILKNKYEMNKLNDEINNYKERIKK